MVELTLVFPDGTKKDVTINRPFIGETYWENKKHYIIYDIIHVSDNLMVWIELK